MLTTFRVLLAAALLAAAGCSKSKPPIVVGSSNGTEQLLIGEIVAQHLEHTLTRKIVRRFALGGELIAYQALASSEITLYPEYTGSIEIGILKETPSASRDIILERTRNEMLRTAQLDLLDPLGYDSPPVIVMRTADAQKAKIRTMTDAASGSDSWKLGASYEFEQRGDLLPYINTYRLPLARRVQGMELASLIPSLKSGATNMVALTASDGSLVSPEFQVLTDDKGVMPPYLACLLVRHDALAEEPQLGVSLAQLSGRFTLENVRKMDAEVDLNHRTPAAVAADFLASVGLK